jgi:ABC-type polysaccharide transport system permease subunit
MTSPTATLPSTSQQVATDRRLTVHQQQRRWGWIFLSPWLIGFAVFTAFPMIASLIFSFTDFKIGQPISFIGLDNWKKLFTDPVTLSSLGVTLRFGLLMLPFSILLPLAIARCIGRADLAVIPGRPDGDAEPDAAHRCAVAGWDRNPRFHRNGR